MVKKLNLKSRIFKLLNGWTNLTHGLMIGPNRIKNVNKL